MEKQNLDCKDNTAQQLKISHYLAKRIATLYRLLPQASIATIMPKISA